jgi:hypothetical protein
MKKKKKKKNTRRRGIEPAQIVRANALGVEQRRRIRTFVGVGLFVCCCVYSHPSIDRSSEVIVCGDDQIVVIQTVHLPQKILATSSVKTSSSLSLSSPSSSSISTTRTEFEQQERAQSRVPERVRRRPVPDNL